MPPDTTAAAASSPPFVSLEGVANLRDVGGYASCIGGGGGSSGSSSSSNKRIVRRGVFYRSADCSRCPAASIHRLRAQLGVTTVFDLRSQPELDKAAGTDGDVTAWERRLAAESSSSLSSPSAAGGQGGVTRVWTPVFREEDYSPEQVALRYRDYASADGTAGFVRAYATILRHGGPAFGAVLRHIAGLQRPSSSPPTAPSSRRGGGGALLVHCTAGKDRTGVLAALLLSILGVAPADIARDYTLTEVGLAALKPAFVARIMASPAFADPRGPGEEGARRMTTCTDEKMLDTLAMLEREYGGAEAYVRGECGLTAEEVDAIRSVMLVDAETEKADPVL